LIAEHGKEPGGDNPLFPWLQKRPPLDPAGLPYLSPFTASKGLLDYYHEKNDWEVAAMSTKKSAAMICSVVLAALFLVPWVPGWAKAWSGSTSSGAVQAMPGQIVQFASARLQRADWDRGDRDRGDWDRGDWDDWNGGGNYFGAPYYGYGYPQYYTPYYYNGPSNGLWFHF
jgi:hypothetical protein